MASNCLEVKRADQSNMAKFTVLEVAIETLLYVRHPFINDYNYRIAVVLSYSYNNSISY